ncbi:unnamed protein product [Spirodela intermedia]|uniref:Uncharacterized protein n=1 Tax=Spirodela intermedia TaxID=51605 RepID=A0A7I8JQ69_SPIIN|nr:unnamed protein product [Spirodela intermedia]CAA6672280.1 unnamed protein product [Spirodela intermedia]
MQSNIYLHMQILKELCTSHRSPQKISLFDEASAIISHSLLRKCKDPRAPLISCKVGETTFRNVLLDLGASVNLLRLTVFENLKLGGLKPTSVELQLADRSIKKPKGLLEDAIINVKGCRFLVDFLILDILILNNLTHTSVILGCPFLATAKANIDCENGIINMKYEVCHRREEDDPRKDKSPPLESIPDEPHQHLEKFHMIFNLVNLSQITQEIIKMKLFSHTLRDKANCWLSTLDRELTS